MEAVIEVQDESEARALLHRFSSFFDGVVVELRVSLPRSTSDRVLELRLLAQEIGSSVSDDGWRSVTLRVEELTSYLFSEDRTSHLELSDGLGLHVLPGGAWLVDLAPYTEADVPVADRLANSAQFCVGRRLFAAVEPYRE